MPVDKRITNALNRLYQNSNETERSVMDGSSDLSGRQQAQVFDRLIIRLALLAGLTGAAIIYEPQKEEGNSESH